MSSIDLLRDYIAKDVARIREQMKNPALTRCECAQLQADLCAMRLHVFMALSHEEANDEGKLAWLQIEMYQETRQLDDELLMMFSAF